MASAFIRAMKGGTSDKRPNIFLIYSGLFELFELSRNVSYDMFAWYPSSRIAKILEANINTQP